MISKINYLHPLRPSIAFLLVLFFILVPSCLWPGTVLAANSDHTDCINLFIPQAQQAQTVEHLKIDQIQIDVLPIFEDTDHRFFGWIYKTANQLHLNTRESVVRKDLLFKQGDQLNFDQLAATERRLRERRYYSDAKVILIFGCTILDTAKALAPTQNTVKIQVKEVWTLEPTFEYSKSGRDSTFGFGVEETNFLGLGTTLAVARFADDFRTGTSFKYTDPNTGFYDSVFDLRLANNDDGFGRSLTWAKPFFSLETPWTAGLSVRALEQDERLFKFGTEVEFYQRASEAASVFFGRRIGPVQAHHAHRLTLGYNWQDDIFQNSLTSTRAPASARFQFPWVQWQWLEHDYIETTNITEMNRIEDINLGFNIYGRFGWTQSDRAELSDRLPLQIGYSQFFQATLRHLFRVNVLFAGLVDVDKPSDIRDGVLNAELQYFWKPHYFKNLSQFFLHYSQTRVFNPENNAFLTLGANLGARGYPARFDYGEHRRLFTLEQRFFGEKEWFSLFYLGSAVFFDMAHIAGTNAIDSATEELLKSVGVGLRVSTNRLGGSDGGGKSTLHIDFAKPVDPEFQVDSSQFSITVKKSF